jgi:hypothetical protein
VTLSNSDLALGVRKGCKLGTGFIILFEKSEIFGLNIRLMEVKK